LGTVGLRQKGGKQKSELHPSKGTYLPRVYVKQDRVE